MSQIIMGYQNVWSLPFSGVISSNQEGEVGAVGGIGQFGLNQTPLPGINKAAQLAQALVSMQTMLQGNTATLSLADITLHISEILVDALLLECDNELNLKIRKHMRNISDELQLDPLR